MTTFDKYQDVSDANPYPVKSSSDSSSPGVSNKVSEAAGYSNLSASGLVKSGSGALLGIFVASASNTPTVKIWDNTSAATTILINTFTPVGGTFYPIPAKFGIGLYVSIGGTVDLTVLYD